MSNYIAVGVNVPGAPMPTNIEYEGKSSSSGFNPFFALFDFIDKTKLDIELALTNPKVQAFMREAGIKAEEAKIALANEKRRRQEKSSMLKWGVAAAVLGFLILRKKK
jgi:hypothetical protein